MKGVLATTPTALLLLAALAAAAPAAGREDPLATAKHLYTAAAYEEALAVLEDLPHDASSEDATKAQEYRVFCLLALDRHAEARRAIQALVEADPLYQLSQDDASPRIQSIFHEIRQEMLPAVVHRVYADAKAAFERHDVGADVQFERVIALLDDPDGRAIADAADLRMMAAGFRDLSAAARNQDATPSTDRTPAAGRGQVPPVTASRDAAPRAGRSRTPVPQATSGSVTPPVPVFRPMPAWRPGASGKDRGPFKGTLEVLIDVSGHVASAKMTASVNPRYDAELLKAARTWRFQPAVKDGRPTAYVEVIDIELPSK